ncbi:MAG: hypothetical protein KAJ23_07015 [Maribacter sp.]|nr:hypothetical protein [Maribacter sp.]
MSVYKKILTFPLRVSMVILLMGMLMKVLEWSLAWQTMLISFITIGILYIVRFWKKPTVQFIDYVKLILVVFWTTNGVFRIMDFPYTIIFQVIIAVTFVIWFIMEGTAYFLDDDRRAKNSNSQIAWNFLMVIGTLSIIAGSLMKLLNWEFAIPLLIMGVTIVALYILKDTFIVDKMGNEDRSSQEYQL